MLGREVGVLLDLGNTDVYLLYPVADCDINRVLITQMGLVTTVLLAPATIEDQKLIKVWLCSSEYETRISTKSTTYCSTEYKGHGKLSPGHRRLALHRRG